MKKIAFLFTVLFSLLIINNLLRSIYSLWQKRDFVTRSQKELEFQKKENEDLKIKLEIVKREDFLETEARNKLFMLKEGESRVVLPAVTQASSSSEVKIQDQTANWEKWLRLFWP